MIKITKLLLPVACLFFLTTCNIINPEEPTPSYIHLEPFTFTPGLDEGGGTSKITEAWVYVGPDFVGAYSLPATFPVLSSGEQLITIDPGISENGIRATPEIYPFYQRFTKTVNLELGKIDTIQPNTYYDPTAAVFAFLETFESGTSFPNNIVQVKNDAPDVLEGNYGAIYLDQTTKSFIVASQLERQLPINTTPVYLEMDYKTDVTLAVGLSGTNTNGGSANKFFKIYLNPKKEWNKIYVNLTDDLPQFQYNFYSVTLGGGLPDSLTTGRVLIDNIKLVYHKQ